MIYNIVFLRIINGIECDFIYFKFFIIKELRKNLRKNIIGFNQ